MSFYLYPGIQFDHREPIPPDFHVDASNDRCDHQSRPTFDGESKKAIPKLNTAPLATHRSKFSRDELKTGFLAPSSATIKVDIVHDTAKFTVLHLFCNGSMAAENAVFQFPLPIEATVIAFNCRIGNERIVRGRVDAKDEARQKFQEARRQGEVAGLIEQQTGEIFQTTLANIPATADVRTELSFVSVLKHQTALDHQVHTFTMPTFISPRYGSLPSGMKLGNQNCESLNLEVNVLMTEDIRDVICDTHAISWHRDEGRAACQSWDDFIRPREGTNHEPTNLRAARVRLAHEHTCLDRDLVISVVTELSEGSEAAQACLETHPTFVNHKALMLTIPRDLISTETSRTDREIIFVADRSGSMEDKIDRLKSAMMFFIKGVPEGLAFNIWCFGTHHTSLWPESKPLTDITMLQAVTYVRDEFEADMGGTEILPVIKGIQKARNYDFDLLDVILLTDGQVWRPEETINYVRDWRHANEGSVRFFALGIGEAVSHELVHGIARAGGGYSEVVSPKPEGFWEDRVVMLLRAARTDHVRSVRVDLEWRGDKSSPVYKQTPGDSSTLNPFQRNHVYILFDSQVTQTIDLTAISVSVTDTNGIEVTKRVLPKKLHKADDTIHLVAARGLLSDLERGDSWLHRSHYTSHQTIEEEAISIGRKWSLVSKWTSMYAVERPLLSADSAANNSLDTVEDDGGVDDVLRLSQGLRNYLKLVPRSSNDSSMEVFNGSESITRPDRHSAVIGDLNTTGQAKGEGNTGSMIGEPSASNELNMAGQVQNERKIGVVSLLRWPAREMPPPPRLRHYIRSSASSSYQEEPDIGVPLCLLPTGESHDMNRRVLGPEARKSNWKFVAKVRLKFSRMTSLWKTTSGASGTTRQQTERETLAGSSQMKETDSSIDNTNDASATEHANSMIQKLLGYQRANGCFAILDYETIIETLGSSIFKVVTRLETQLDNFDIAVTIVVIALLEQRYEAFHSLWVLMVGKARGYIADSGLGHDIDQLIMQIKDDFKSVDVEEGERGQTSFTELEVAPTV